MSREPSFVLGCLHYFVTGYFVTGYFVTGYFVTGYFVTGHFVTGNLSIVVAVGVAIVLIPSAPL